MSARGKCVRTRAAAADGVGPARTSPEVLIAVVEAERGEWGWIAEGADGQWRFTAGGVTRRCAYYGRRRRRVWPL